MIKAAEDCALQYMNFMNVIFAAQKQVSGHSFPLRSLSSIIVFSFIPFFFSSCFSECPYRCLCARLRVRSPTTGVSQRILCIKTFYSLVTFSFKYIKTLFCINFFLKKRSDFEYILRGCVGSFLSVSTTTLLHSTASLNCGLHAFV